MNTMLANCVASSSMPCIRQITAMASAHKIVFIRVEISSLISPENVKFSQYNRSLSIVSSCRDIEK